MVKMVVGRVVLTCYGVSVLWLGRISEKEEVASDKGWK